MKRYKIRHWCIMPDKKVNTVDSFKRHLNQGRVSVPKHFYTGSRRMQILHTRLRTYCSSLKSDLHSKNIVDSPLQLCDCRSGQIENADHFFFRWHLYRNQRLVLQNSIFGIVMSVLTLYLGETRISVMKQMFLSLNQYINI